MLGLVIVVVLGSTVLIGTTLGGRYRVAPPVLLICLGGLLGLIPELSAVELDPDVVLLLFLPAYFLCTGSSHRPTRTDRRRAARWVNTAKYDWIHWALADINHALEPAPSGRAVLVEAQGFHP